LTSSIFGNDTKESDYMKCLHEKMISAILESLNNIMDASLEYGRINAPGLAFNARFIKKDGTIETHPWKDDPDVIEPEGPVDDELYFIYARDRQGDLMGGIVNYANHPQVMERQNTSISADFPGAIEKYINKGEDTNAVILFMNGASGNICPVNAQDSNTSEVGEQWLEYMGKELAEKALSICNGKVNTIHDNLLCIQDKVDLQIREVSQQKLDTAIEFLKIHDEKDELLVSNYGIEGKDSRYISLENYIHTNEWLVQEYRDIIKLHKIRECSISQRIQLSVALIGDVAIVALPFEVFVEHGLKIKERSPFKYTVVCELTNGSFGYLPTKKAFTRSGGYETITLCSSRFTPDSGEKVVNKSLEMLHRLYKDNITNINTQHNT
jgi:neutral ceramidase